MRRLFPVEISRAPNVLSFSFERHWMGQVSVLPFIDGTPLSALIAEFEATCKFDDSSFGYEGLVPAYCYRNSFGRHFLGRGGDRTEHGREIYVLGCSCGDVGCKSITVSVRRAGSVYLWSAFKRPQRPNRDYAGFGPFLFERRQYERAVRVAASNGILGFVQGDRSTAPGT